MVLDFFIAWAPQQLSEQNFIESNHCHHLWHLEGSGCTTAIEQIEVIGSNPAGCEFFSLLIISLNYLSFSVVDPHESATLCLTVQLVAKKA